MPIPISNVTRRVVYAASGTGPYAFTFEILANTDIAVYKDDALLTLTTDYTVTIASNGTGSITLVASPTGATQIAIVGNRTIQRTTDFVTGGDFFANTVNDEMDQQTIFAQQNAEGLQRALSAPQTDPTSINMTLPRAALRANKALGFDANGNPVIADTLGTNRGNWAASTLYYVRDIVKDTTNNNIWQAIVQHTSSGSQPINTNSDSAKWTLLVDAAAAATSATNAASSASAAATSASAASSSATAASGSASTASTQASNASTSASNASSSASAASSSATSAASSATSAAASYDAFDDRYLGSKSSDPTVDNDGNTLLDGALYWDTTNNIMKVYDLGATTWRRTTPTSSDQANINTVSGIAANVTTVAGISANVTTVAGISANVTSVAGNSTNINTVATDIANVNATGGNIANVNAVAGNATNINAVNSNATNINTVAGISANVTTVATNNANVTTVAGSIASVNTNATNIANINQNAANITAIQNASANATAAASSATAAASSATSAASSAAAASAVVLGSEPVRPSVRPSLLLDFANTKQLDPRITFTRASTATFYNGVTTAKAEQNLLVYSQEFETAGWGGTGTTATANTQTAPDGTSTADVLTATAATSVHTTSSATISLTAASHAYSVFAKAGTNNFVQLRFAAALGAQFANFDLSAGTVGTSSGGTAAITSVGNGWYRCSLIATTLAASSAVALFIVSSASAVSAESWTTAGTESIYIWGAQLEQRSAVTAYTVTTTQPITNYIPVLQTAASGVARFDHNPTTFESLGLEIEESRTNLVTYSEQFDNAGWNKSNSSITANTIVAPDGAVTGDKLVENTANNTHFLSQGGKSVTSGAAYTLTCYAKAAERISVRVVASDSSAFFTGYFNLSTGVVTSTTGTGTVAAITAVGNGWYRCSVTFTATVTAATADMAIRVISGTTTDSYTGDGYSGIYIWGAQLEAGAFATSYIPTVASQVTRSADAASMTGTDFSSWYNQAEGTLYVEAEPTVALTTATNNRMVFISDGTTSNRIELNYGSNSGSNFRVDVSGVTQASITNAVSTKSRKASAAYKVNDFAVSFNAGAIGSDTAGAIPVVSQMTIGAVVGGVLPLNGTIRKIAYYPLRVTNAQLQGMTTV